MSDMSLSETPDEPVADTPYHLVGAPGRRRGPSAEPRVRAAAGVQNALV
jgi:hypothetical protein